MIEGGAVSRGGVPGEMRLRARVLVDEEITYANRPPLASMAELIELVRAEPRLVRFVVGRYRRLVGQDALAACWLALVLGEARRPAADEVLLEALGRHDVLHDEAVAAGLIRRADVLFERVVGELECEVHQHRRGWLYELLDAVALSPDARLRERLKAVAQERWRVERERRSELLAQVLGLMVLLGESGVEARVREARELCERGSDLDRNLNDVLAELSGEMVAGSYARGVLAEDWRASARNLSLLVDPPSRLVWKLRLMIAGYAVKAFARRVLGWLGRGRS